VVSPAQLAHVESQAIQASQANQDPREREAHKACQDGMETVEKLGLKVSRDPLVYPDLLALLDHPDQMVSLDLRVRLDLAVKLAR
jgi:hypothetical protein